MTADRLNLEVLAAYAARGDQVAIGFLMSSLHFGLVGYIRGRVSSEDEARDIATATWEKLLFVDPPAIKNFDASKGALTSYIWGIANNLILNHRRKRRPKPELPLIGDWFEGVSQAPGPDDLLAGKQLRAIIAGSLSPLELRVFLAVVEDGLRHAAVAEEEGISVGHVGKVLAAAKTKAAAAIKQAGVAEDGPRVRIDGATPAARIESGDAS